MTTDGKCVENLACLSDVKGLISSSRVTGRGQRDVLELPTAAGAVLFRRGAEVASCFRLRGLAHYQYRGVEKCMDIKVSVCGEHTLVVSSCDTQEASNMVQEALPATMDKSSLQVAARRLAQGTQTPSTVLVRDVENAPLADAGSSPEARPQDWRNPRLVPKTRLSERSKLLERCQLRLTASSKRPSVRERPRRNSSELAKRSNRRRIRPRLLTREGNRQKRRLRQPSLHS